MGKPPTVTRRELLELGALASIGVAAPGCGEVSEDTGDTGDTGSWTRESVPEAWEPGGEEDAVLFPLGVQAGDPSHTGAVCWTQYVGEGSLVLRTAGWDGAQWTEASALAAGSASEAGTLQVLLDDLPEDSWYCFYFENEEGARSAVGRFRTPPESGLPMVVFGGISCTRQRYQPFPALSQGAEELVDFVFLCGDQVYTDYRDTVEGKREEWASNLSSQGYRDLLTSTAVIATWDDHEIENAWGTEPTSSEVIEAGKTAFFEHTPLRVGRDEPLYRSLRWADTLEIFVLDGRSERVKSEGIYLSKAQFDWFVEAVTASTAHFKLVLNSVPIADFSRLFADVEVDDRWDGYPEARWELLNALEGVENLFFISGDFHMGLVCHVESEGFAWNFYDVLVGPGGQYPNPIAAIMAPNAQFPIGVSASNFTRLVADPHADTLLVEYIGETGEVLASIVLPEDA